MQKQLILDTTYATKQGILNTTLSTFPLGMFYMIKEQSYATAMQRKKSYLDPDIKFCIGMAQKYMKSVDVRVVVMMG